ncbi:4-amino-4-deoxy-L-arabinose transferase-like glycosyltransferase [Pseudomonas chlororaphis]|uniref:ArnT family glycosyltransferase n=1 Tax=Pseudomonas chlororaphis TaxID=587753 RepID=UPI00209FC5BF|nr:glycosyltransferase family 39 protein [Pseudomonas chlororaphis]MCP1480970.1 4-amino-4-deoxy-L-arabinose transferase-like glycosyltransferase [Pseudomonas chlororaphis]MCP1592678.1 4-amino-4-deoxy-L-arabinose transferase-like glycosyltransferase [Pseudomonas chlororaphis]
MSQQQRFGVESSAVFLLALLLFTFGIWDQPAQGFDGRWWLFLQEMFRHGASLFPTTYGEPYPDYPGTATLFSYGFAQLFGAPNELANILPTALASAGVLALLYRLLAPFDRTWALLAVLLTALTTQWLEKSRSVCLDQMVSLLCLGCFYLLHSGEQLGSKWRQYAIFPLFVIAFAIRGPLGLIEVCGVACTYWALSICRAPGDGWRLLSKVLVHGLIGLILLAACWWALMQLAQFSGGEAFARKVYQMQVGGRLDESGEPLYFYFQLSLYRYFPVVPLALATLFVLRRQWSMRHSDDKLQLLARLGACGLMILLGLSVPHFKRAYYILPMVPMFAAVAAYGLLHPQRWLLRVRWFYLGLVVLLPGLCAVVLLVCRHSWQKHGYWPALSLPLMMAVFFGLQVLALHVWQITRNMPGRRLVLLSLLALAAQWWLLVKVIEPAKDLQFATRGFVDQVEQLRGEDRGTLVFLNLGKDTWAVRYMMNLDHDEQPRFIGKDDLSPLASLPRPAWVILARKDRALLAGTALEQATPVFEGRLNDNPCLVFALK